MKKGKARSPRNSSHGQRVEVKTKKSKAIQQTPVTSMLHLLWYIVDLI